MLLKIGTKQELLISDENWDEYVISSHNGTLFHLQKFLQYHPAGRFQNISPVYRKRDEIVALATFALLSKPQGKILSSYPGASWGSFVSQKPLTYRNAFEITELTVALAKDLGCDAVEITLPPSIYAVSPNDNLSFCLLQKGFRYKKRELTSIIDLREKHVSYDRSVKKAVNKSLSAGITIDTDSQNYDLFYELLSQNISEKGSRPTHSLQELLLLKQLFPNEIQLMNAFREGKYIGGLCNWMVKKGIWLVFYSCYDKNYLADRVLNRLFYECVQHYLAQNASFIDFGTSSINMEVNEGLINFKELYSAYGVFRDTLALNLT